VAHRFGWLQPYVMNPPRPLARLVERWEREGKGRGGVLRPIRRRLKRWNTREVARPPLDPALRRELRDFFAADVEKLGKLLDRDLGHWR
jgi:hypothetical protein